MAKRELLKDKAVRDLAWLVNNPPIIQGKLGETNWTDSDFWQQQHQQAHDLLLRLDANPSALYANLDKQKDHRLGHRFETLLSYFFNNSARYQILAQNLQVQNEERTIGEFDFIIQDTVLNKTQHWEVACKFYLGLGDTTCINNWHGPMLKDRLDIKFNQMQCKQSQLSNHPAAALYLKAHGINIDQHVCLMKGRLFHPIDSTRRHTPTPVSSDHQYGWWARPDEFIQHFKQPHYRWLILNKGQWFASQRYDPNAISYNSHELLNTLMPDASPRPTCIAGFNHPTAGQTETTRGFLIAKDWANELTINHNS